MLTLLSSHLSDLAIFDLAVEKQESSSASLPHVRHEASVLAGQHCPWDLWESLAPRISVGQSHVHLSVSSTLICSYLVITGHSRDSHLDSELLIY